MFVYQSSLRTAFRGGQRPPRASRERSLVDQEHQDTRRLLQSSISTEEVLEGLVFSPNFLFMSRNTVTPSFVGTSARLPIIGSGRGPGGRGSPLRGARVTRSKIAHNAARVKPHSARVSAIVEVAVYLRGTVGQDRSGDRRHIYAQRNTPYSKRQHADCDVRHAPPRPDLRLTKWVTGENPADP